MQKSCFVFFTVCLTISLSANAQSNNTVDYHRDKTACMASYYGALIKHARTMGDDAAKEAAARDSKNCMNKYSVNTEEMAMPEAKCTERGATETTSAPVVVEGTEELTRSIPECP